PRGVDGAVLGSEAMVLRFFGGDAGDRLLFLNLGRDMNFDPAPEPLLGPPPEGAWGLLWSSEQVAYGGAGAAEVETEKGWRIPGNAAVVLQPRRPAERPNDKASEPDRERREGDET